MHQVQLYLRTTFLQISLHFCAPGGCGAARRPRRRHLQQQVATSTGGAGISRAGAVCTLNQVGRWCIKSWCCMHAHSGGRVWGGVDGFRACAVCTLIQVGEGGGGKRKHHRHGMVTRDGNKTVEHARESMLCATCTWNTWKYVMCLNRFQLLLSLVEENKWDYRCFSYRAGHMCTPAHQEDG